ncbi:MAG: hypothetical protein PWQ67_2292 [Clostridia bacterium]|jgi:hypothetical protein|nr:hypothetical protein [Clostridia bacterium]MDN5323838.1 hypothetical protein [Clostridia bacterium]
MTHTLHRVGTVENLDGDYVFLCMPSKDINHVGSGPKLRRFFEIALKHNPVKIGDARLGNEYHQGGINKILENVEDRAVVQALFNNKEAVIAMMKDLKEEDLGLSVVLSGLGEHVGECCNKAGLQLHTVEHSLGRWGKTEKLPPQHILEIATMCGHAMVAVNFIQEMIDEVKKSRKTAEAAAEELFKPCMCGIFNTDRAAKLIKAIVEQ